MNAIIRILMERDGETFKDAYEMLKEARERVAKGEDPQDVLEEEFGLEPDYIYDLI